MDLERTPNQAMSDTGCTKSMGHVLLMFSVSRRMVDNCGVACDMFPTTLLCAISDFVTVAQVFRLVVPRMSHCLHGGGYR